MTRVKKQKQLWLIKTGSIVNEDYDVYIGREPKIQEDADSYFFCYETRSCVYVFDLCAIQWELILPNLKLKLGQVAELVRTKHGFRMRRIVKK